MKIQRIVKREYVRDDMKMQTVEYFDTEPFKALCELEISQRCVQALKALGHDYIRTNGCFEAYTDEKIGNMFRYTSIQALVIGGRK